MWQKQVSCPSFHAGIHYFSQGFKCCLEMFGAYLLLVFWVC